MSQFKHLIEEIINESNELVLNNISQQITKSSSINDLMKSFVGKTISKLSDASNYANLYNLNKYGVGVIPDEEDPRVILSDLMNAMVSYVNFRKVDPLMSKKDEFDKSHIETPEYKDWYIKRNQAFKRLFKARREDDQGELKSAEKAYADIKSQEPSVDDRNKVQKDANDLIKQFQNTPLTINDVLPNSDDSEKDKERLKNVKDIFEKAKKIGIINEKYSGGLRAWFGKGSVGSSTGGGWDRYNTSGKKVGKCGDADEGSSYSACLGKKYAARLRAKGGKKAIANWVKKKKAAQRKSGRGKKGQGGKGMKPVRVSYKESLKEVFTLKNTDHLKKDLINFLNIEFKKGNITLDGPEDNSTETITNVQFKDWVEGIANEVINQLVNYFDTLDGQTDRNLKYKPSDITY